MSTLPRKGLNTRVLSEIKDQWQRPAYLVVERVNYFDHLGEGIEWTFSLRLLEIHEIRRHPHEGKNRNLRKRSNHFWEKKLQGFLDHTRRFDRSSGRPHLRCLPKLVYQWIIMLGPEPRLRGRLKPVVPIARGFLEAIRRCHNGHSFSNNEELSQLLGKEVSKNVET